MIILDGIYKTYNGVDNARKEFKVLNEKLAKSAQKASFLGGVIPPIMSFVGSFGYVAVCIVGALLTMNNVIGFGTIIAFIFYVRLFSNPLNTIAQSFTRMQSELLQLNVYLILWMKQKCHQKNI